MDLIDRLRRLSVKQQLVPNLVDHDGLKEIHQQIKLLGGDLSNSYGPARPQANMTRRLLERQTTSGFVQPELAYYGLKHLPNQKVKSIRKFHGRVFCGIHSDDGEIFMGASQDGVLRLFDANTHKLQREIDARDISWSIIDADYSPDRKFVAYSSWSPYVHLCNVDNFERETHVPLNFKPPSGHFCLFSIRFSPDSRKIIGGSSDSHIYIYDLERNERTHRINAHNDDINAVCFLGNDQNLILSGSDDRECKLWDMRVGRDCVGKFVGHFYGLTYISPKDDTYFITNSKDSTIKLWDKRRLLSANQITNVPTFAGDYRFGVLRSEIKSKDKDDTSLVTYRGHRVSQTLIRAKMSPHHSTGGKYVYSGCGDGYVHIWDTLTGEKVSTLGSMGGKHGSIVRDVSWHPYEQKILSASWDGTVGVWSHVKGNVDTEDEKVEIEQVLDGDDDDDDDDDDLFF